MAEPNTDEGDHVANLLARAKQNDAAAVNELLTVFRARLRRMVQLRMNRQLLGRVDASDVVQDAYLEASKRLPEYLADPKMPFFLWLRHITGQKVINVHRQHLQAQMRSAGNEISLHQPASPVADSVSLAGQLAGTFASPSHVAVQEENRRIIEDALNGMDDLDREILTLRHFEQVSNAEAAELLGISTAACSKRHIRALRKLQGVLSGLPGFRPDGAG